MLEVVHRLHIPTRLNVVAVVGKVVARNRCRQFVEALHQHAVPVEVPRPQRPLHRIHPPVVRPTLHHLQQLRTHLGIVHKVDHAKASDLRPPPLVVPTVHKPSDPPHHDTIPLRQPVRRVGELENRVLRRVDPSQLVCDERRNPHRRVPIELERIPHEPLEGLAPRDQLDLDIHPLRTCFGHGSTMRKHRRQIKFGATIRSLRCGQTAASRRQAVPTASP